MIRVVRGHGLQSEGRPYLIVECNDADCVWERIPAEPRRSPNYDHGHGLCACGATSPHLLTDAERQLWYRDHKNQIRGQA
jgi:hypothetical protein